MLRIPFPTGALALMVVNAIGIAPIGIAAAAPPIDMQLATEPGFPLGGERRWIEAMEGLPDVTIRVRGLRSGERPEVRSRGNGFEVLGVLTSQNRLRLKGATFGLNDRRAIIEWLDRLRADGADGITAVRGAFGMTAEQLAAIHDRLKVDVGVTTKNMSLELLVDQIARRADIPVVIDPDVRGELASALVLDELTKVSCGTALAAALRVQGLVVALDRRQDRTALRVTRGDRVPEFWPIGYDTDSPPRATVPSLFTFLEVEINDTPLAETLAAIGPRLGAPLVIDRNNLARDEIDLETVRVNVPAGRTYYKRILDRALSQAKLRSEIRVDEAGTPFLWITTIRRGD